MLEQIKFALQYMRDLHSGLRVAKISPEKINLNSLEYFAEAAINKLEIFIETEKPVENATSHEMFASLREKIDQCETLTNLALYQEALRILDAFQHELILKYSDPKMAKVYEYIRSGMRIQAIKEYRTVTGKGLADSKDAVDCLAARMMHDYKKH